eukprot:10116648-Alexandrium_andersonii.AAC.1
MLLGEAHPGIGGVALGEDFRTPPSQRPKWVRRPTRTPLNARVFANVQHPIARTAREGALADDLL